MSDTPIPDSLARIFHTALDFCEPVVELVIRLCGWSAILFVFAIFFFVFREAAPAVLGDCAQATVVFSGQNNNLTFSTQDWTREYNDTEVVLNPVDGGPIAFRHDPEEARLTVDFDPEVSTANGVVNALASDPLIQIFSVSLTDCDDGRSRAELKFDEPATTPNDGTGLIAGMAADLADGRPPLDLGEFFTSINWRPDSEVRPQYGILALLVGTVSVTTLAMFLAVPLGLGAAIYVSEFAGTRMKETLKVVIELLAAIPSVVWGFIGYMVLGPIIIWATGAPVGINITNGGIILAMMSVPIIVSVSEDALRAVPDSYREAAVALGASRWEIVYRVLFPAAKNGLLAAVLLGVGRGIGETMAVLMATGHAVQIPHSLLDPVRTLTATIAAELGETVSGDEHYRVLLVSGVVLFAEELVVNLSAELVVKGIRGGQND